MTIASIRDVSRGSSYFPENPFTLGDNYLTMIQALTKASATPQASSVPSSTGPWQTTQGFAPSASDAIAGIIEAGNGERADTARRIRELSPAAADRYAELTKLRALTAKQAQQNPGLFWKIMDQISRPLYGVAGAVGEAIDSDVSDASNPLGAFWKGLTLDEKVTTADILEETGAVTNPWAKAGLGFVGDVLMDPLTWTGFGSIKSIGSSAARTGSKALAGKGRAAISGYQGDKLVNEVIDLAEEAARVAGNREINVIGKAGKSIPIQDSARVLDEVFNLPRIQQGRSLTKADQTQIFTGARRLADAAGGEASNAALVRGYQTVTDRLNKIQAASDTAKANRKAIPILFDEHLRDVLKPKKYNALMGVLRKNLGVKSMTVATKIDEVVKALKNPSPKLKKQLDAAGITDDIIRKLNPDGIFDDIEALYGEALLETTELPKKLKGPKPYTNPAKNPPAALARLVNVVLQGDVKAAKKLTGQNKIEKLSDLKPQSGNSLKAKYTNTIIHLLKDPELAKIRNAALDDKTGFAAYKDIAQSAATRDLTRRIDSIADLVDDMDAYKQIRLHGAVPFIYKSKRSIPLSRPYREGRVGRVLTNALSDNRVSGALFTGAKNSFDKTFNTASRIDSSIGNVVSKSSSNLSMARDATARVLNEAFDGFLMGQRVGTTRSLINNTSDIKRMINNPATDLERITGEQFADVTKRLRDVLVDSSQGSLESVGKFLTGSAPYKFRIKPEAWEKAFKGMTIEELGIDDFAERILRAYKETGQLGKNIDIAELLYHLDSGVLTHSTRLGMYDSFKSLALPGVIPTADPRKAKQVPSMATNQILAGPAGKNFRQVTPDDFKLKVRDDPNLGYSFAKEFDGYFFHEDVIPALTRAVEQTYPVKLNRAQEWFTRGVGAWKRWATIYNIPYYHLRNTYSDMFMNDLNGLAVTDMFKPKGSYHSAGKVLRNYDPNYGKYADNLYEAARQTGHKGAISLEESIGLANRPPTTPVIRLSKKQQADLGIESIDDFQIISMYREKALQSHFINEDIARDLVARGAKRRGPGRYLTNNAWTRNIIDASGFRENYFRMANFIHSMKKGLQEGIRNLDELSEYAADKVRKYNFDYGDFTPREQTLIRYIFPFYKWTRRAVPTLLVSMYQNPRVFNIWNAFNRNFQQSGIFGASAASDPNSPNLPAWTDTTPSWMLQAGGFPIAKTGGDEVFGAFPLPSVDTLTFLTKPTLGENPNYIEGMASGALDTARGLLNPALQVPFNLVGGTLEGGTNVPKAGDIFSPSIPGREQSGIQQTIDALMPMLAGPVSRLNQMARYEQYAAGNPNVPPTSTIPFNPALVRSLTGTTYYANTEPRQLAALNQLLDWQERERAIQQAERGIKSEESIWRDINSPYTSDKDAAIVSFIKSLLGME